MIQEHADDWERKLVPLLRGDNRAELRKRSLNEGDGDDKGALSLVLEDIMGKGLIPADPETWAKRRRAGARRGGIRAKRRGRRVP